MIRLIVAGSRLLTDEHFIFPRLNHIKEQIGEKWAKLNNIPVKLYFPNWKMYGKSAGPKRNLEMIRNADALVVFRENNSRGASHILEASMGILHYRFWWDYPDPKMHVEEE